MNVLRSRRRRARSALVVAAVAAPLLLAAAGCGAARPGAAAVVGDHRIDISTLQARLERTLNDTGSVDRPNDATQTARSQLTALITHQLLVSAAASRGVSVTPGEIDGYMTQLVQAYGGEDKLYSAAADGGVAKEDVRQVISDQLLEVRLGQSVAASTPVVEIKVEHILVKDQATADTLAAQVRKDPSSFAALAAQNSLDTTTKGQGGDLGYQDPSSLPQQVQDASVGDVLVVQAQDGWHVVRVLDHRSVPLGQLSPDDPIAAQHAQLAAVEYLVKVARDVGVSVNPRYGVWDAKQLAVGAASNALSSPEATPTPSPIASPAAPAPAPAP